MGGEYMSRKIPHSELVWDIFCSSKVYLVGPLAEIISPKWRHRGVVLNVGTPLHILLLVRAYAPLPICAWFTYPRCCPQKLFIAPCLL